MKQKKLFLVASFLAVFSLNTMQAQYAIEANYGLSGVFEPSSNEFKHFGAGISYDFNEVYGIKLDFASDKFRVEHSETSTTGINSTRISLQATVNISTAVKRENNDALFNIIVHAGGGISTIKPYNYNGEKDNGINAIMGITPRLRITEGLYFSLDTSLIFNISQHYNFDGTLAYEKIPNSFTGITYSVTGGIIYKIRAY